MKNPKLLLTVGGGVFGAFALIAVVFIVLGVMGASDAEEARKKAFGTLKSLYNEPTFPSEENIEVAHANRDHATAWAADLSRLLSQNAPTNDANFSGSWFKEELFRRLDTLRADAPLDDSGKPVVDEAFAFDFERYAADTPDDENVPRLHRQLNLIDRFVRVLYAHGIHHLDAVGRVSFEDGADASASSSSSRRSERSGGRSGGRRGGGAQAAAPTVQLKVTQPEGQTEPVSFARERIGLAFRCRQAALLAILDDIDASWPYAAVSGLRIEKLGDDVRFPDEAAPKKDGPAAGAPAPAADANRPARRTIRLVSGALRDQLVQVELYLDLYRMDASEENPDASSDEEDL